MKQQVQKSEHLGYRQPFEAGVGCRRGGSVGEILGITVHIRRVGGSKCPQETDSELSLSKVTSHPHSRTLVVPDAHHCSRQ